MIVRSDNNIAYDNVMTPIYNDRVIADGGTIETLTEVEEVLSNLGDQDVVPSLLWVAEGSKVGKDYSILPNDGSGDFDVTRAGDTAFTQNPDLTWRPALPNEPRFTYENGVKGRLIENAATRLNAFPFSIENAAWLADGITVDTNSGAGYDGVFVDANGINTKQGRKLVATANNGSVKLTTPVAVTAASQYVNSVYIKRLVGTGTIYLVDVNNTDRAITVTSEWTRVQYAAAAAGTTGQLGIKMATAGDEVMVCYMPIEAGTVASSPIGGAEGATQTRNADNVAKTGVNALIGRTEWTIYMEMYAINKVSDGAWVTLSKDDAINSRIILYTTSGGAWRSNFTSNTGLYTDTKHTSSLIATGINKVAITHKDGEAPVIYANGSPVATISGASSYTYVLNNIYLGRSNIASLYIRDAINNVQVFKSRLPNATLQALTTL